MINPIFGVGLSMCVMWGSLPSPSVEPSWSASPQGGLAYSLLLQTQASVFVGVCGCSVYVSVCVRV